MISRLQISCIALALLCAHCKKPDIQSAQTADFSKQSEAQTSTVIGYWKDNSTSVTTIDATPGYTKVVVYSVGPMTVAAGDVVSVHVQRQFGQNGVPPIMVAGGVIAASSATAVDNNSPALIGQVLGWSGSNLTAAERGREVVSRTGSYRFASAASNVYINAVFYGQALTDAGGTGDLTLPTGNYGELVAVLERGVTWQQTTTSLLPYNSTAKRLYVPFSPVLNVNNSIGPVTIPENAMVDVRYDAQATTNLFADNTYQTYGRNIVQGSSPTATSGVNLTKQTQVGITHREHHSQWSHAGGMTTTEALSNAYFNSVVYSNGWEGENLYIDPGSTYLYGRMNLEVRPYVGFYQDVSNNVSAIDATEKVLYSVGPIDIDSNQVVEVRYQAAFALSNWATVDSKIIRAASPTATTGVTVQAALARGFDISYYRNNLAHSTAERPATAQRRQYYNVVVWRIQGTGTITPQTWGELEVIKR